MAIFNVYGSINLCRHRNRSISFGFLFIGFTCSCVCLYLVSNAKLVNTDDFMKKCIRHFEIIYPEGFKFSNNSLLFLLFVEWHPKFFDCKLVISFYFLPIHLSGSSVRCTQFIYWRRFVNFTGFIPKAYLLSTWRVDPLLKMRLHTARWHFLILWYITLGFQYTVVPAVTRE